MEIGGSDITCSIPGGVTNEHLRMLFCFVCMTWPDAVWEDDHEVVKGIEELMRESREPPFSEIFIYKDAEAQVICTKEGVVAAVKDVMFCVFADKETVSFVVEPHSETELLILKIIDVWQAKLIASP